MRHILSALAIYIALAVPPTPAQEVPNMAARMNRAATFYQNRDGFMGMVAVARDHQIIFQRGYGYANLEAQIRFTPDTRFRIGSLTKQFTAAAILLLEQDGKLRTSDPITRFYPNSPAAWSKITLRNLLTHTSGIPDIEFGLVAKNSLHTPEDLMKGIPEKSLEFQPGTKAEYANINFMLSDASLSAPEASLTAGSFRSASSARCKSPKPAVTPTPTRLRSAPLATARRHTAPSQSKITPSPPLLGQGTFTPRRAT